MSHDQTFRLGRRIYINVTQVCRTCKSVLPPGTMLHVTNTGWTKNEYQCSPCETEDEKTLEPMDA